MSISLTLTNFKCHRKLKLKFNSGLYLLFGDSGKGKTSILEAIFFALYGKGSDLITHGEKKCCVKLKMNGMIITRKKGPNRLLVEIRGGEGEKIYEDVVAQAIINKKFGNNFLLTSYMIQKADKTFLKLSPNEKSIFLEQFIFGGVDIAMFKEQLKTIIKKRKDNFDKLSHQIEILTSEFKKLEEPKEVNDPLSGKSEKDFENSISLLKSEIEKKKTQLNNTNNDIEKVIYLNEQLEKLENVEEIDEDILKNIIKEISRLKSQKEEYIKYKNYIEKKKKYDDDLISFNELKQKEMSENEQLKEQLKNKISSIELLDEDKVEEYREKKEEYLKLIKKQNELSKYLKLYESVENLKNKIDKLEVEQKELENKISDINNRINVQTCPHCFKSLIVKIENNKNVIKSSDKNLVSNEEKSKLPQFNTTYKENKTLIEKLKKDYVMMKELDDNDYVENMDEEIKNIDKILNNYENNLSNKKMYEKKLKEVLVYKLSSSLTTIKNNLDKLEKEIKIKVDKIENIDKIEEQLSHYLVEKNEFENKIKAYKKWKANFDDITEKINRYDKRENMIKLSDKLKNEVEISENKYKKLLEIRNKLSEYKLYQKELNKYNKKKEELKLFEENVNKSNKSLLTSEQLNTAIKSCESYIMKHILYSINENAKQYINKFFPNSTILAELKSRKENKKSSKPEINLSIQRDGIDIKLSSLSGGERDRIELAFMLALNKIYNGEIILLDECLSSLHEDLCNDILELLKESNGKTIIVISHQVNTGIFDSVINI
jgi:DNA repair protein SbcC/Rad50